MGTGDPCDESAFVWIQIYRDSFQSTGCGCRYARERYEIHI